MICTITTALVKEWLECLLFTPTTFNSSPANDNFRCLLMSFENSLDPDQAWHIVGPDLDPYCLQICSVLVFIKELFEKLNLKKTNQLVT